MNATKIFFISADGLRLDATVRKVIEHTFSPRGSPDGGGWFPDWRLQGFKIVNLYTQRTPRPEEVDPNDQRSTEQNPATTLIGINFNRTKYRRTRLQ